MINDNELQEEFKLAGSIMRKIYSEDQGSGLDLEQIASSVNRNMFVASQEKINKTIDRLCLAGLLSKMEYHTPEPRVAWKLVFGRGLVFYP